MSIYYIWIRISKKYFHVSYNFRKNQYVYNKVRPSNSCNNFDVEFLTMNFVLLV